MPRRKMQWLLTLVAAFGLLGGCSGDSGRPITAPVTGRITYRGKPVSEATVAFIGERAPRFGIGQTDAHGRFQVSTFVEGDGAVIGAHIVTVTKPVPDTSDAPLDASLRPEERSRATEDAFERALRSGPMRSLLPEKYADPNTTDIRLKVVPGENDFKIELVD
jgi:hypothetical protein